MATTTMTSSTESVPESFHISHSHTHTHTQARPLWLLGGAGGLFQDRAVDGIVVWPWKGARWRFTSTSRRKLSKITTLARLGATEEKEHQDEGWWREKSMRRSGFTSFVLLRFSFLFLFFFFCFFFGCPTRSLRAVFLSVAVDVPLFSAPRCAVSGGFFALVYK